MSRRSPASQTCPMAGPVEAGEADSWRSERSPMSEPQDLDSHQLDTLVRVCQDPTGRNIEWHDLLTLLEGVGSVERNNDLYLVHVGNETQVLRRPPQKDVDVQQIAD